MKQTKTKIHITVIKRKTTVTAEIKFEKEQLQN